MNRLLAFASLLVLCGCVSDIETDEAESGETQGTTRAAKSAVVAGMPPQGDDNLAKKVVKIHAWNPDDNAYQLCTGTAITSTWVLTASHCIHPDWHNWVAVYNNDSFNPVYFWASNVVHHPLAAPWSVVQTGYLDAALVELTAPLTGPTHGWTASPTVSNGQSLKCYGFGVYTESGTNANVLRFATLSVASSVGDPQEPWMLPDYRRYKINKNSGGQILAEGDSGGPCFDFWTHAQVGVQSTVVRYTGSVTIAYAEQVKFNTIRQWVIDTITGP